MLGWIVAFLLAGGIGVFLWWNRWFPRHWRQLEQIIDDLSEGREPRSFVFLGSRRFMKVANLLERLADSQERIRRKYTRQEMNFATILASMQEGVLVVDRQHTIRVANPPLVALLGLGSDPVGQTVLQALRIAAFDEMVTAALRDWRPQTQEFSVICHKQQLDLWVSATPMRNASGEEGVVTIVRDVTRLKQLEDMRREFVANVSHELRTPLAVFRGYLEDLRFKPDVSREELASTVAVLEKHSFRLNALVEDLLILARLESRVAELELEDIDVQDFIAEMMDDWKLRSAEAGVSLRMQVEEALPVLVADSLRLSQVLNNLLDNAFKYSPKGGEVRIIAGRVNGDLELRVEDDGAGIPAEDVPHIFERFYRADKARSREKGGTGLGLSIVKHIAQAHGGSVRAESRYGEGTAIIVRLPFGQTEGKA